MVDSIGVAADYPRLARKYDLGNDHIEDLTDADLVVCFVRICRVGAVCRIRRRACFAVRTACAERNAEFFKQFDKTHLYARTANTFHIDKHYAVFEIYAEFGVGAFVFVIEVDADVCFQAFENGFDVEIEILPIYLRHVFHTYLLKIKSCLYVEFETVVHLVGKHEVESQTFE